MSTNPATHENVIVVGVDGSEPSKSALRWAARMSAMTGATIDAVTAWQPPANYGWGYAYADSTWRPDQDAEKVLTQTVDAVFGPDRPVGMRLIIPAGKPRQGPARPQREGAIARDRQPRSRRVRRPAARLGQRELAEHASCPVLVVHGTATDTRPARPRTTSNRDQTETTNQISGDQP